MKKYLLLFSSLLVAIGLVGCGDNNKQKEEAKAKEEKKQQEIDEIKKIQDEIKKKDKEANKLKTDDGRKINIEIYKKYNVKYPTFEPTDNKESKDKAVMERFEEMAKKNNMSAPEYIAKEKDIVAANVQKDKEEQMKKRMKLRLKMPLIIQLLLAQNVLTVLLLSFQNLVSLYCSSSFRILYRIMFLVVDIHPYSDL